MLLSLIVSQLTPKNAQTTKPYISHFIGYADFFQGSQKKKIEALIFPKLSFAQLCLPRSEGSVQLLDPHVHQHALLLRWLMLVLKYPGDETSTSDMLSSTSITTPYLVYHLLSSHPSVPDHRLLFLFSGGRSPSWKQTPDIFKSYLLLFPAYLLILIGYAYHPASP